MSSPTWEEPLVSIGMPVYNGEKYLREALDSLVGQSYPHLEIIVSDNASEDATEAICREYAARDARVQYHRAAENGGAIWNFRRVFELSRGEYFMWAAFDDVRHPSYVQRCMEVLRARPDVVQCSSYTRFIGEEGQDVPSKPGEREVKATSATRRRRVRALTTATVWYDFYGLMRAEVLRQTRGPQPVWGFDVVLMLELYLHGRLAVIPEPLFSYRVFEQKTGAEAAQGLGSGIKTDYPAMVIEMIRGIGLAPVGTWEKGMLSTRLLVGFCQSPVGVCLGVDLPTSRARARKNKDATSQVILAVLALFLSGGTARYWLHRIRCHLAARWRALHSRLK